MLNISRNYHPHFTIGLITYEDLTFFTLELPWLQNSKNISCYPSGVYKCRKIVSQSLGSCIEVMDVPERTYIRIHAGNYLSQIQGCTLVGTGIRNIDTDTPMITNSKDSLEKLMAKLPTEFMIEVN